MGYIPQEFPWALRKRRGEVLYVNGEAYNPHEKPGIRIRSLILSIIIVIFWIISLLAPIYIIHRSYF